MGKAVVVFSGGQDSTTCLLWAKETFDYVEAVIFDYGQRNFAEIVHARSIAEDLGVAYEIIKINLASDNALTNHDLEIKQDEKFPNTFVPGRNQLFLTYASIYAKSIGAHHVITGVSQIESSGYPDCSNEFIKSFGKTISIALDYDVYILTPLMYLDKVQTWELADKLGGFELVKNHTVTCYRGIARKGCGECPSCKLRNESLEKYLNIRKEFA